MKIKIIGVLFLCITSQAFADNSFFNCSNQKYRRDKLICSDPALIALATQEEQLTKKTYSAANAAHVMTQALQYKRSDWLENERKNCHTVDLITDSNSYVINQMDVDCFKSAFIQRNNELNELLKNGFFKPGYKPLAISNSLPDKNIMRSAEVIFISGYGPTRSEGHVDIAVNRPGKKVVLILSSYDSNLWNIDVGKNTNIAAILLGKGADYQDHIVASNQEVPLFKMDIDYAYEIENIKFQNILASLHNYFDLSGVDYFQGGEEIPVVISVNRMQSPDDRLTYLGAGSKHINNNFNFDLITIGLEAVKWSTVGANKENQMKRYAAKGLIASAEKEKYFKLVRGEIEIDDPNLGSVSLPPMPAEFPKFSNLKDIALDTKRNILLVVSDDRFGSLYRFDLQIRKWLDFRPLMAPSPLKMAPFNIFNLAYDAKNDRYFAWARDMNGEGDLLFISADCVQISKEHISNLLPGLNRLYDEHDTNETPLLKIIPQGKDLIFVNIKEGYVNRIWHYDLETKVGTLTYVNRMQSAQ